MKTQKIIALLLVVVFCIPLLAACAESGGTTQNTRPSGGDGNKDVGDFVSADYNNEEFTFLFLQQPANGTRDYFGGNYLDSEGLEGLTIEDAVFKRNQAVEDKYKVTITQHIENVNNSGDPVVVLRDYHNAGDHFFDVIYGWGYKLGVCIAEGLLADISTLPNVKLDQEYWSPSSVDELSINNKLYITINDISMNKLEWGGFIYFNKKIVEDYNLESEEYGIGNFYDRVKDGTWTYDVYLKAVSSVSNDLDGDGSISREDVYGLIDGDSVGLSVLQASGITYTAKADDGSYKLNYYNDKALGIAEDIQLVYSNNRYVKTYEELGQNADIPAGMDQWQYYRSFFTRDKSLFCIGTAHITGEFRNMESEYGIIPMPKYNEDQENYISMVDSNASLFAIPVRPRESVGSFDRTGTILEYMSYKSNQEVLPKYYETLLKGQRLSSEDDQLMLDTIRTNIHYEFSDLMGFTEIRENCEAVFENPASSQSKYKSVSRSLQKQLDDFYTEILLKTGEE